MNLSGFLSRAELLKLVRFGAVGLSASLLYAAIVGISLQLRMGLLLAHCLSYALSVPSSGTHLVSLPRFLLTNGASFLLSTGIVAISRELQLAAAVAVTTVVVVAPLINYLCLNA